MKKTSRRGFKISFRLIIVGLLVLVELVAVLAMIGWLKVSFFAIYSAFQFIGALPVIYIINKPDNPSYRFAWIMFIVLVPMVGCFFYLLRGGSRVLPRVKKRMRAIESSAAAELVQDAAVAKQLETEHPNAARQSAYLYSRSGLPVYDATDAEYISPGEKILPRVLTELEKAERSVYLEFFIISEGIMWDSIHKILKEKAARGVDVRVIFDDFGSINRQSRGFISELRADGIKVSVFNPLRPSIDMFMNNRNHRKIIVIDGKVAVTGGFNIGDEYINHWVRHGYWMDSAMILKGRAARSFEMMFLGMWSFINNSAYAPPPLPEPVKAEGFVQPYCDGPFNLDNPAQELYLQILHTAKDYVYITTPYLILDDKMEITLALAAESGVDVRIITPKVRDKWYVHPVTRSYYAKLLRAGVKIYEYTPGFMHAKLFVSDDTVATVGSVNMDYRSFYFHFECGAWLCGSKAVTDIREHFEQLVAESEEITLAALKAEPLHTKLKQAILRLFAPFM